MTIQEKVSEGAVVSHEEEGKKPKDLEHLVQAGTEEENRDTGTATVEEGKEEGKEDGSVSIEDMAVPEISNIQKGKEGTPKWLQTKIDKAVAAQRAAETRAAQAEEKSRRLETEKAMVKEKPIAPHMDDYDTSEEWRVDMDKYQDDYANYRQHAVEREAIASQSEIRVTENKQRLVERAKALNGKFPDMIDRIESTVYGKAGMAILGSESNAEIAYYLQANPDQLKALNTLPTELKIATEIGKLEQRMESARAKTTSAPQQLNNLEGNGGTVITKDPKDMTDSEWFEMRKREKVNKFKGG